MNTFKKIVAAALSVATLAATSINASAYTLDASNYNKAYNWLGDKTAVTTSTVKNIPEPTVKYMNNEIYNGGQAIDIKLDHYPKKDWVVLAFPKEVNTAESAYRFASYMRIKDYWGNNVITELKYNKDMGRYVLVSWGTLEQDYNGKFINFLTALSKQGELSSNFNLNSYVSIDYAGITKTYLRNVGYVNSTITTKSCFPFFAVTAGSSVNIRTGLSAASYDGSIKTTYSTDNTYVAPGNTVSHSLYITAKGWYGNNLKERQAVYKVNHKATENVPGSRYDFFLSEASNAQYTNDFVGVVVDGCRIYVHVGLKKSYHGFDSLSNWNSYLGDYYRRQYEYSLRTTINSVIAEEGLCYVIYNDEAGYNSTTSRVVNSYRLDNKI